MESHLTQGPTSAFLAGPTWPGLNGLKHLIIFGDSYSSIGYDSTSPHPSAQNPLGVPVPGRTSAESGKPNWVGHLIASVTGNKPESPLMVYDYAVGGARTQGVKQQIQNQFLPHVGMRPDWARWDAGDTLFVTWVGINDSARGFGYEQTIEGLFSLQEELFESGARNFLFIDVPPIHRTPAGSMLKIDNSVNYIGWNTELKKSIKTFADTYPSATVLTFSSWDTFTRVLDKPTSYGFKKGDVKESGGPVWVDHLHPTTKVHGIIARDLEAFLMGIKEGAVQE